MKKGILIVSFGSSYEDTRKKCIESIENLVMEQFPTHDVRRAFTSNMIIKKLKTRDKIHVNTPQEALQSMVSDGMDEIIVQPLHIIPGFEYDKVKSAVLLVEQNHKVKISLGLPLLFEEHHYDELINSIIQNLPSCKENEGIIMMGHGTEHYANACYSMLQSKISKIRSDVFIANVEGYPMLEDIMSDVIHYKHLTLQPLMLVAGDHAINDMAGDEESFKTDLETECINVSCVLKGLGELDDVRKIFVNRVVEMLG